MNQKVVSIVAGIKIFKYHMHLGRLNKTAHISSGPQHSLIKSKGQYFRYSVHKTLIIFTLTVISSSAALHY